MFRAAVSLLVIGFRSFADVNPAGACRSRLICTSAVFFLTRTRVLNRDIYLDKRKYLFVVKTILILVLTILIHLKKYSKLSERNLCQYIRDRPEQCVWRDDSII